MLKEEIAVEQKSTIVFVMFYALGLVTYIPQRFYITANDYWMYKFRNPYANATDTIKTQLQTDFTSVYSIVSNVGLVVVMLLTIAFANRIRIQKRIVGSISVQLMLFVITIVFVWINTDPWQQGFFIFSLIIGTILNGTGACYLVSIFELSARFPAVYLGALIAGEALCGIVAALVQILTLAIQASSKINAFIYFLIGAAFIVAVEVSYLIFSIKVKHFRNKLNADQTEKTKIDINGKTIAIITKKIAGILSTMILVQGATVIIHPGVTALVESSGSKDSRWGGAFFVPVCTFLLNSTFDFVGRECARIWKKPNSFYIILVIGALRLLFVPLLMFCNVQPRNHLSVLFPQDYVYSIFMVIFAFTNGYLINLSVLKLSRVCEPQETGVATFMILLVMIVSMASCSFGSKLLIMLI